MSAPVAASIAAGTAAVLLCLAGCLHLAWAFGWSRGRDAVIPTIDGRPTMKPSRGVTVGVAVLLLVAADLYMGTATGRSPEWLFESGATVVALVLLGRVVGDRRTFGLTKRVRGTAFARLDDRFLTPFCLVLSVAGLAAVLT